MDTNELKNKIWNIEFVVDEIKKFPQTYGTILQCKCKNTTDEFILRRKLNKLCEDGTIYKTFIPGTRFGRVIFYTTPKDYFILVEKARIGSVVYCFFEYENVDEVLVVINKYWLLKDDSWKECNDSKKILSGNILKWL